MNLRNFKLFGESWGIGGIKEGKNGILHSVIYGPNKKQFHVYGDEALSLRISGDLRERGDVEATKIYILTKIFDIGDWHKINGEAFPAKGSAVKVILEGPSIIRVNSFDNWHDIPHEGKEIIMWKKA